MEGGGVVWSRGVAGEAIETHVNTPSTPPPRHPATPPRPLPRAAFTLIELLVASALVGLVAVSLFASLRLAMQAKDAAERKVEPGRTADIAFEVIRRDLENAVPPTGIIASTVTGGDYLDGRGREGDTILLFTTAPGPQHVSGDGEVRRVEYLVLAAEGQDAAAGEYLLVRRVIHNLTSPTEPPPEDEVLIRGVGGFNLRYYDGTSWLDWWDSTQYNNALPTLMEVAISVDRPNPNDGPNAPPRTHRFTRLVQLPCAVPQPATGVNGL